MIKKAKRLLHKPVEAKGILQHAVLPIYAIVLFVILVIDISVQQYNYSNKIIPSPIYPEVSYYPILTESLKPNISAKAAIVMDNDSKVILFAKNPKLLFSMASTTKIMTALVAMDYYSLDDVLTVKTTGAGGITIGLKKGQRILFKDLLHAMLLPSSNDAALTLAQNYSGGEKAFINKMNEYARLLHLFNTSFADPAGLLDGEDYTTPLDLARLASIALKNKMFAQIVATKHKIISDVDGFNYSIFNLNKLLGIDGINGVKTGFTDEAGEVLVTSKKTRDGHMLIAVVMNSEDRFLDTKILLNYVSGNIKYLDTHNF
ncbi:MAG: serine hydrolase [Patescibacteria group bacterium]